MYGLEKVLNELTLGLAIFTMVCAFLFKNGVIKLPFLILMCIITIVSYLSSRMVIKKNSTINENDKAMLSNIEKEIVLKKGKKKNVKKDSSNSR